jgi:signal transduction histidine kinase/DNA-binding response OmpR family regulator/streptogramin lyase
MRRLVLIFSCVVFFLGTSAQQPVYTHFKRFTTNDGLPQSFVSALAQDEDGFLWIGTRDGLARYDGREFRVFRHDKNDSTSLSSNIIYGLYLDSGNLLWVLYENFEFDCFNPRSLQVIHKKSFVQLRNLFSKYEASKFFRDHSGKFWLGTHGQGVICFDPVQQKTTYFNTRRRTLASGSIVGILENQLGEICIFTDKGLDISNTTGTRIDKFIPFPARMHFNFNNGKYHHSACLPNGDCIVSNNNRLIIYDAAENIFRQIVLPVKSEKNIIRQVLVKEGLVYITAGGGVYCLNNKFQLTYLWQNSATRGSDNSSMSFFVDHSNVMWFGTNAAGLCKVDLQSLPFTAYSYHKSFVADVLSMLPGLAANNIPPSLKEGFLAYALRYCYLGDTLLFTHSAFDVAEKNSLAFRYNNDKLEPLLTPPGTHHALRGLSVASNGVLYAINIDGDIWKWQNFSTVPDSVAAVVSIGTNGIADLEADDNKLWVSTYEKGLFEIKNNRVQKNFKEGNGKYDLPTSQLTDLCKDPVDPHILWIGTLGQGLVKWNTTTGKEKVFTTDDGLSDNVIYSIVPDNENDLWISTNNGISRLNLATNAVHNFDVNDGLNANEFNRFHGIRLPDGRIAFGGMKGFTIFDPDKFTKDSFITKVALTKLYINNVAAEHFSYRGKPSVITQLTRLTLPYNRNFLTFEFAGLEFNRPKKIRYRYRLEGYNNDWIDAGNNNVATYTRLPSGKYTLLVNASNTSGNWSPFIRKLSIIITPPLWATWWAYTLYFLISATIVYFLWRYNSKRIEFKHQLEFESLQTKKLKEIDQLKMRFFANISHEFRTPLTLIKGPIEDFSKDKDVEKLKKILPEMQRNSNRLLQLINQLLDLSKLGAHNYKLNASKRDIIPFVKQIVNSFSSLAHRKDILLETEIDPRLKNDLRNGVISFYFDEDVIEKILFNLLSNSFKFTPSGGNVTVILCLAENKPGFLELRVEDNGIGIAPEKIPYIFDRFYQADHSDQREFEGSGIGLSLVKELVELHGGSITSTSEVYTRTAFSCYLPLNTEIVSEVAELSKKEHDAVVPVQIEEEDETTIDTVSGQPTILVVEDQQDVRKYIREKLNDEYNILEAKDGLEGLEVARAEMPDLVISDVMMPGRDGFEVCRSLKTDNVTSHIPVILLTARAEDADKLAGLETGADAYLIKPFNSQELNIRVQKLVEVRAKMRAKFSDKIAVKPSEIAVTSFDRNFMQQLLSVVEIHIADENFSVEQLGREVHMSTSQINRKLKALIDQSAQQFIRSLRMQRAMELLKNNTGSVSEIAYQVGFVDPGYFSKVFKSYFGQQPSEVKDH